MNTINPTEKKFSTWIINRFSLRFHMGVLLFCTGLSGALTNWLLFQYHFTSILARYPIAVIVAYFIFFVLLRIWLSYIFPSHHTTQTSFTNFSFGSSGTGFSNISASSSSSSEFKGGGGSSGGGGASGTFEGEALSTNSSTSAFAMPISGNSSSSKSSSSPSSSNGGAVLLVGFILIAVIMGTVTFFMVTAPQFLSETAFQFALAGGMIPSSQKALQGNWLKTTFKETYIPFMLVLVLSALFGQVVRANFPTATNLKEVVELYQKH